MAREIFIDSSGFFALLSRRDEKNSLAQRLFEGARRDQRGFITTDYVLDETATLLKVRGERHLVSVVFETVFASTACRVLWTDRERFDALRAFFLKHLDQEWSFTDCLTFCVMKEHKLSDALTADHHFTQAGFVALLA